MHSLSRGFRLALILSLSLGYVAAHHGHAYAQDDDESGEDEGGDEGGDEPGADEDTGEDEEGDDKDQPPVTSGGLFTLKTYPVRELFRPLTMTEKILQVRLGVGVDVSAKGAFESWGVSLEGEYGFRDNVTGIFGFTNAYNFKSFGVYAGIEAALGYDLVDFRGALRVSRAAGFNAMTGESTAGDVGGGFDVGFPFRYVARPEIAIIALDTLMSIDFDSKPDLTPSIGISTNPIAPLSVVLFAQLQIIDFDTTAENFKIPATARIQFSPSQKLDLGAEFTFLNMKPTDPDGDGPAEAPAFYESRFLTLYIQSRFGR